MFLRRRRSRRSPEGKQGATIVIDQDPLTKWVRRISLVVLALVVFFLCINLRGIGGQVLDAGAQWWLDRGASTSDTLIAQNNSALQGVIDQYEATTFPVCDNPVDPPQSEEHPINCIIRGQVIMLRNKDLVLASKAPDRVNPATTVLSYVRAYSQKKYQAFHKANQNQIANAWQFAEIAATTGPISQKQLAANPNTPVQPCLQADPAMKLNEALDCVNGAWRAGHNYPEISNTHLPLIHYDVTMYDFLFALVMAGLVTFLVMRKLLLAVVWAFFYGAFPTVATHPGDTSQKITRKAIPRRSMQVSGQSGGGDGT